ncbi:MFS transporter [Frigoribacterium sp. UYMn621]|uniref:MFS transporter n=1 Tax=Frigoribacterium sp. UYMn621 TaxID=3156343 RepID=UPI00339595CF
MATPLSTTAAGLSRPQVLAWRNALFAIFGLCGLSMASWASRIPAVKEALQVSTSSMGILIFGIAAGSIVGLLASSHVIARIGARRTIAVVLTVGAVGFAVAGFGVTIGPSYAVVMIGLIIFGSMFSICDVAMNLQGAVNERVLGRSVMPVFHAFFSFGTVIGAALGAGAEAIHLPIAVHLLVIAVIFAGGALVSVRFLQSEHIIAEEAVAHDDHSKTWRGRLSIWRDPRTLVIGLIVLGMAFTEGSANDWLALAMVEGHDTTKATGALVLGIFVASMTVGRLAGVSLLDRFGRVPVLRGSAVLAAIGLVMVIFVPVVWISIIGVVFWGLGASLGFPVGMSAAADDPKTAAARVSAVATIGYFAFLVGPPVIGFLGQHVGLLHALLVVLVLVAIAGFASGAAREPLPAKAQSN